MCCKPSAKTHADRTGSQSLKWQESNSDAADITAAGQIHKEGSDMSAQYWHGGYLRFQVIE
jgi:hypothetical protein